MRISLIVGLGNSDPAYAATPHNAGFLMVDYLRAQNPGALPASRERIRKSAGAMNGAGASVAAALRRAGAPPAELLVIHDDTDLPLGSYRYAFGRGSAGHKGVESVIAALGTSAFWRLRIGIRPAGEEAKADALVLAPLSADARAALSEVFARAAGELERRQVIG